MELLIFTEQINTALVAIISANDIIWMHVGMNLLADQGHQFHRLPNTSMFDVITLFVPCNIPPYLISFGAFESCF